MKRSKVISLASLALAGVVLTSCAGLNKMKKEASNIKYQVTPEVLEAHADMVDVKVTVNIPAKYFNKNVVVVATPVLKFEGGEKAFPSKTLQGEKVQGNNTVVPFETGKTISYTGKIPYEQAMRISDLEVRMVGSKGEKSVDFDPYKIADGVVATATLVQNTPRNIVGKDAFQRIIPETQEADLHYLINSSQVRWSEMKAEDVKALKAYLDAVKADDKKEYKGVEVSAYASPDGKQDWNEKLAGKREVSSSKYIKKEMKRAKMAEYAAEDFFKSKVTPEDWEGFQKLMKASNIQDKELILRVLSMYSDPEVREKEIRNISAAFDEVKKEVLPKLRRSKFSVNVDLIGKTDAELKDLGMNNPSELNVEELLYSATLVDSADDKLKIYEVAKKQFSKDWRGYNDAGMILFGMNKVADAKSNFEQADKLSAKNPVVKNNLGAVELVNGNVAEAEVLFGAATGAGKEVNYNQGIVAVKKAEYDTAVKHFGECNGVNAALANILDEKYNVALDKLNANTTDAAMVYYLKAVVGARTANNNLVFTNLETAVAKDASLKAAAKTDMEFAKVFEDAKFKAIVE
ncbi:tetratricopeptide repeat protein [Marinifilum sp. RC60d5]|uniref:tetratricopeptide repeat protein n=1 Tax=Marinifilum sp. RC60d5 TaxID=3458414 RepID=UPI004036A6AE